MGLKKENKNKNIFNVLINDIVIVSRKNIKNPQFTSHTLTEISDNFVWNDICCVRNWGICDKLCIKKWLYLEFKKGMVLKDGHKLQLCCLAVLFYLHHL